MKKTMKYRSLHEDGKPLVVEYTVDSDSVQGSPTTEKQVAQRRTRTQNMNYAAYVAALHTTGVAQ